jgi:hypothetical protein
MFELRDSLDLVIRANRIRPIGMDTVGACGYDDGIYVTGPSRITISRNVIRDFIYTGIAIQWHEEPTDATITRNLVPTSMRAHAST